MFGKSSGFIVRSLFATFVVGSLVACTFEQQTPEQQGLSTSAVDGTGNKKSANGNDPTLQGADASANDNDADSDGGAFDQDGDIDGGSAADASADGSWGGNDGGSWGGNDGGWGGNDGGSWGGNDGGAGGGDAGGGF